jgi:site-specific recombinase XerD
LAEAAAYRLYLLGSGKSHETAATYLRHLSQYSAWCERERVNLFTAKPLILQRNIVDMLDKNYARGTVNTRISALKSFYRWLILEGKKKGDPTRDLKMHKEKVAIKDPFTETEARRLVDIAETAFERAILLLLLGSGVRRSELIRLEVEDINWRVGTILVHGKGLKQRHVAPGYAAMQEVRTYLDGREYGRIFLWPGTGRQLSRSSLGRLIHGLEKRAGITNAFPHRFRTTMICWLLTQRADLIAVSVAAGHSSLDTTRRYQRKVEAQRAVEEQRRHSLADRVAG